VTARLFAELVKDVTAIGVHARTAIGNARRDRKQRSFSAVMAQETDREDGSDGQGGLGTDADDGDADIVTSKSFAKANVVKVDNALGLVFGFAIVCKVDGSEYFDLQGDHIPESAMLAAATDFMLHSRVVKEMHTGGEVGSVVFAFPLTSEIAKALDITTKQTGLLIAMKPSPDVLGKYADGTYTGFSSGGARLVDEAA
jgi:hypothetical protein